MNDPEQTRDVITPLGLGIALGCFGVVILLAIAASMVTSLLRFIILPQSHTHQLGAGAVGPALMTALFVLGCGWGIVWVVRMVLIPALAELRLVRQLPE